MKNINFSLAFLLITVWTYSQGQNWETIALPNKSKLEVIMQTADGTIIGRNSNNLGNVISKDNGQTWESISTQIWFHTYSALGENYNRNIYWSNSYNIIKYNIDSKSTDTFKLPRYNNMNKIYSTKFDFILGVSENNLVKVDATGVKNIFPANTVRWTGASPLSNECYVVYHNSTQNQTQLHQIKSDGSVTFVRNIDNIPAKYFLHGTRLIRNTEYSTNQGLTWQKCNVPFTEPDTIFNYNSKLAFVKGNRLYFESSTQNVFDVLTLPQGISSKNLFVGKTIIAQLVDRNIPYATILKQPSGNFEPIPFDLAVDYCRFVVPGRNGNVIAIDPNGKMNIRLSNSSTNWILGSFTVNPSFFWDYYESNGLSINKDNIFTLKDSIQSIYTSADAGETWQLSLDSIGYFYSSEREKGTYLTSNRKAWKRELNTQNWKIIDTSIQENGVVSNQEVLYSFNPWSIEIFAEHLNNSSSYRVIDIPNYHLFFDLHYEMNYFYDQSYINYELPDRIFTDYFSASYDNGATFEKFLSFPNVKTSKKILPLWSGHFLQVDGVKVFLSDDYGKSWTDLEIDLNDYDRINDIKISPDNYLYILSADKGLLRLKNQLPQANIIRLKITDDFQSDCMSDNDVDVQGNIKITLDDQATQIVDKNGEAVFYTFKANNNLIIHDDANVLNLCSNTIPVDFPTGSGHVDTILISAEKDRICSNLELTFKNYDDSLNYYSNFPLIVKNTGNSTSPPTKILFTADPYTQSGLYILTEYTKIDDLNYLIDVDSLQPGQSFVSNIGIQVRLDVPIDRKMCFQVVVMDYNNQCNPNQPVTVCRNVDKQGRDKTIKIRYYMDLNTNCVKDAGEPIINENIGIKCNEDDYIARFDSVFYYLTTADTVVVMPAYDKNLYTLCKDEYKVILPSGSYEASLDIPVKGIRKCSILGSGIFYSRYTRCFDNEFGFSINNRGNAPSKSIEVKITVDNYFEVGDVNPNPLSIIGNVYTFSINPIEPNGNANIKFKAKISCAAPLQYKHCHSIEMIEASPNCGLNASGYTFCEINGGSFDPNDKTIYVSGKQNEPIITDKDDISYRIRFQNTGTDTAYNVKIEDYLSRKFDVSSVRLLSSTHPCQWSIDNRVLKIEFPNINLVDSFRNVIGSQGEVTFSIKLNKNVEIGDEISNSANIFFDFNDPVMTNKVISTFGKESKTHDLGKNDDFYKLTFEPNPSKNLVQIIGIDPAQSHEVKIYNAMGELIKNIALNIGESIINIDGLAPTTYYVVSKNSSCSAVGKLVKM